MHIGEFDKPHAVKFALNPQQRNWLYMILKSLHDTRFDRTFNKKDMETLDSMRMRTAAQRIVSDIGSARDLASTTHDSVWVVFEPDSEKYSLYRGGSVETRSLVKNPASGQDWSISFKDPQYKGVDITEASFGLAMELLFDPWGDATTGGSVVLNNKLTIDVEELTGKTEIRE